MHLRAPVASSAVRSKAVVLLLLTQHEISDNVVCATNKASDQPAHTRSLTRAYAIRLTII